MRIAILHGIIQQYWTVYKDQPECSVSLTMALEETQNVTDIQDIINILTQVLLTFFQVPLPSLLLKLSLYLDFSSTNLCASFNARSRKLSLKRNDYLSGCVQKYVRNSTRDRFSDLSY